MPTRNTMAGSQQSRSTRTGSLSGWLILLFALYVAARTFMESGLAFEQVVPNISFNLNPAPTVATNTRKATSSEQSPDLTILTAFSANHLMEGVNMIRSLIKVNYTGPLAVYIMHTNGEVLPDNIKVTFATELKNSPFKSSASISFIEVEEYASYCFKPRIIQDYLYRTGLANTKPKVLHWADTSVRYESNPSNWATAMLQDGIDFSGTKSVLGMGENTHDATYKYLNMSKDDFKHKTEIRGGVFLMNLHRQQAESALLQPWMDCARECHTCMAPPGSTKRLTKQWAGPPSTEYIGHRQDQSVLGLLLFQSENERRITVRLDDKRYIDMQVKRRDKARSIKLVD